MTAAEQKAAFLAELAALLARYDVTVWPEEDETRDGTLRLYGVSLVGRTSDAEGSVIHVSLAELEALP